MKNYYRLLFFIYVLFTFQSFSQSKTTNNIDSLTLEIKTLKGKSKFNALLKLSDLYSRINLDSAKFYTNIAFKISQETGNDSLKIKALTALGFRNFESGTYNEALTYFKKALPISKKLKDSTAIADLYNGFAITYSKKGDLRKSISYNFKTLAVYEKIKDSLGMGNCYLNIGWDYRKLKEFEKSLQYNLLSLKIYEKLKDSLRIGMINNNIAGTKNELQYYNEALEYAKKSKDYFIKLNFERYTAYPISVMAVAYDSLKNYKMATKNYKKAIKLHTINREPFELAFLNYSLSNLYYKQKQYNKAIELGNKAFDFAKEVNSKEYIADVSKLLAKIYEKKKQYKLSNTYLKKYIFYNDSIISSDKLKAIKEIETKYETEKKEKEIALQKEELLSKELLIKNRNLYIAIILGILLLLAVIFYGVYKKNRFKRKQLLKEIDLKDALATIKTQNRLQEQRLRISRDLHDNIGSQLTFIISSIDNLKYISKDANIKLKEKLTNISSFTGDTIHQLRDTIWAMNKNEISVEDLHARILSFVEKAKTAAPETNIEIDYSINKNISFTSLAGMNIFRVIQESINNAIKYANANKIQVEIDKKEQNFIITIIDNGKGFDINTVTLGNGLSNMEKRMSEIGGKVSIDSQPNQGTKITLTIIA